MSGSEEEYEYSDDMEYEYDDGASDDEEEQPESSDDDQDEGQEESKEGLDPNMEAPKLARTGSYKIFTLKMLIARQKKVIRETQDLMGWTKAQAGLFLRFYKWNAYKLQEQWFEDSGKVIVRVGFDPAVEPETLSQDGTVECPSCWDDVPASEAHALPCGHRFCKECWTNYLTETLVSGPGCIYATCPMHKCKCAISMEMWENFAAGDKVDTYRRYVLRSFADENRDIAWCTAPRCDLLSYLPGGGPHDICCPCGNLYCFKCKTEAHRPAACPQVRQWSIKNSAESENVTWIMANTKNCPKCSKPIEKNQGCNHMTCRINAGGCSHEFCWMCMGDWKEHGTSTGGYYRCNRYEKLKKEGKLASIESKRDEAKHELERYMHYFERFMNHKRARKFGLRSLVDIEKKMERLLHEKGYNILEVLFLKDATNQVIECRRILQWTYVFGFYLEGGREKELFEHLQEKLEVNCEALHELVEKPLDVYLDPTLATKKPFLDHRTAITNYSRVTKKFRENLLTGIDSGLTNDYEYGAAQRRFERSYSESSDKSPEKAK